MTEHELKQKLYEVMFTLDDKSAGKDYVALRQQHIANMNWVESNGLIGEYYNYFVSRLKRSES